MAGPVRDLEEVLDVISDWAGRSARSGRQQYIDPDAVSALVDHLHSLAERVSRLEGALQFYADVDSWSTMSPADYRRRFASDPASEARIGRMRLVAPGRALPAVLRDAGNRAREALDAAPSEEPDGQSAA